jgi:hypothetical protein
MLGVGLFLFACGGGAPVAEPAMPSEPAVDEANAPAEPPPETNEAGGEDPAPSASGDEPAGAASASSTSLSEAELQLVMQQVLDDPDLDRYFHLNKPGRLPVKIHAPDLPEKLKLTKGGHDVKFVDKPKSKKDVVLVFTRIERDGDSVRLRYEYDVEGIRGSAVVYLKGGKWRLGANRVIEK